MPAVWLWVPVLLSDIWPSTALWEEVAAMAKVAKVPHKKDNNSNKWAKWNKVSNNSMPNKSNKLTNAKATTCLSSTASNKTPRVLVFAKIT